LTCAELTSAKGKQIELKKERGKSEPTRRDWLERVAEPASNSNSNESYSLKHTSIPKHNVGSMNATINYIKPKFIENICFSYEFMLRV
jgi:hypothetical protein